jgi:Flp pilus assembly protein CpaB
MTAIRKLTSTREGTLALAVLAALIAAATLLMFMHGYKRTLDASAEPVTVLVAKDGLPKGSSGDLIARKGLFQATGFKREQVKDGAITDPASLRGVVAVHDIVRGQQLTTSDFAKPSDPVLSRLGADERAISIPLDEAHGIIGRIAAGDHVDVLAGFEVQSDGASRPRPIMRTLLQDVEVLQAPPVSDTATKPLTATGGQTQNVVLRVPEKQMGELAFSSDNGKVWIVLRPQAGATQRKMSLVTLDRLLLGMDPIPVDRFLGKKRSVIEQIYRGNF